MSWSIYIHAYRNLKFSVDNNLVLKLGSLDVFIRHNNNVYKINASTKTALN